MKILRIILFLTLVSCSATKNLEFSDSYWAYLENKETYLYSQPKLDAIVQKEITVGSIVYVHKNIGEFTEIYTRYPENIKNLDYRIKFRGYIYNPKFKKITKSYTQEYGKLNEIPFDPNQSYVTGERGGCYYKNKHGNKTYVDRGYCSSTPKKSVTTYKTPTKKYKSKSKCSTRQCSGRTKKGSRCRKKTTNCSGRCHLH